jgi:hypothetical protein
LDFTLKPIKTPGVSPGERGTCELDFVWNTNSHMPPMLAVVHATIHLEFEGGQRVDTLPVTFVMRSRPEVALDQELGARAGELADRIKKLPGWKSPAVEQLVRGVQ